VDDGARAFSLGAAQPKQSTGRCHGRQPKGAQARYLGDEKRRDLILHDLDQEGIPLYSLAMVKTSHRRPRATVEVGQTSTAAGAPFDGTPTPRCALTMVGKAGAPPPSDKLAQEALVRRINGGGWLGGGGSVLGQIRQGDGLIYRGKHIYS
jgi:hypothetical protein